ncbi:MAG TPA: hypothetical protein VG894_07105 [Bauldia sp.]|nr:hypothetical protein [Bauldia sp.]
MKKILNAPADFADETLSHLERRLMAGLTAHDLHAAAAPLASAAAVAADEANARRTELGNGDLGITVAAVWQARLTAAPAAP